MKNTASHLHHYCALNSNKFLLEKENLENLNKKKPNLGESWADKQKLFEEN
ncbi:hypothetical protein [Acinetobacter johnsonii]|uniref:hypothetical protein n=1 Tax=Acinetobacter johnsonii TaxID=40214 RepID=UPI003AF92D56